MISPGRTQTRGGLSRIPQVLIIEDDTALQTVLERVIHTVEPRARIEWVTNGEEALNRLLFEVELEAKPYDLVIADVYLEGRKSGLDFWQACQQVAPDTAVLIMSSMSIEAFLRSIGTNDIAPPFLPKPFSVTECRALVEGLLSYNNAKMAA